MTRDDVVTLVVSAMEIAAKLALPLLAAALIVGLIVSVFQAVTQIQEMSLSFVPKLMVTAAVIVIAGPWMLDQLVTWCHELYGLIPQVANS